MAPPVKLARCVTTGSRALLAALEHRSRESVALELAEHGVDVTGQYVGQLASGVRSDPRVSVARALELALGIPVHSWAERKSTDAVPIETAVSVRAPRAS